MAKKPTQRRQRDAKGRFVKGNPGGPGRPPAAKETEYLNELRMTVDLQQWQRAVSAVLVKAQEGDVRAFEALAKYLLPMLPLPQEESCLRLAGDGSPAGTIQRVVGEIARRVQEAEAKEARIRQQGYTPWRETTNGSKSQSK